MSIAGMTHEVVNQSTPLAGVNLFWANRPLRDALNAHVPRLDVERLVALGAEAGSAEMQTHARLANANPPVLHSHDRQGRRIDEVEFHPSYHALMGRALHHGLHGAPWLGKAGAHVERAAAFMLFTEAEASVLCPVSMSYAVAPALRANASSEVEFDRAHAWLVGEEGRGVAQILAMGAMTRLDCALGTAGLMRQSLSLALHHTAQRRAFGKPLIEQPLMRNVLADLALESEAATALALRLAIAVDRSENGRDSYEHRGAPDGHEAVLRRLLTPIAKFWVCKRGSHFAQEAMECLGGNGYVEEGGAGVMARIYREMPLNSIWEGAGNIMALDLLRALRGADVAAALEHEFAPTRGTHAAFDRAAAAVLAQIDGVTEEAQARRLAREVALVLQASLLHRQAPAAVFEAFCRSRLDSAADVFGLLPADIPLTPLVARAMPLEIR